MFDYTRKIRPKSFLHLKICIFFWTICVFNKFLGLKKRSFKFHSFCQIIVLTLINCSLIFVMLNITRKTGQFVSFHWKGCLFFSKNCDFNNILGPKELILLLPQYLSEYLSDLYNSSLEVCHSRYYEKITDAELFFSLKMLPFFSKSLWFQQPPGLKKNALANYTVLVWTACGPL